ncbi:hypothetical protein PVK06_023594 [Gossypium arboreum]|uniref:Uncharacterized protein n=1 Tax=Gossypium arboreum TaxID=29729 RepID=A0ABR0PBS7_GOSAR|nr:hypothetical protein PVK06_023594 [Gossypium arboreum]
MANMTSIDSAIAEPSYALFNSDRFLDGTLPPPSRFIQAPHGSLAPNPSAQVFKQQDCLLTSWLLSRISTAYQTSFTDAQSTCDVWTTSTNLFVADTSAKHSHIRHELHSLKKALPHDELVYEGWMPQPKNHRVAYAFSQNQLDSGQNNFRIMGPYGGPNHGIPSYLARGLLVPYPSYRPVLLVMNPPRPTHVGPNTFGGQNVGARPFASSNPFEPASNYVQISPSPGSGQNVGPTSVTW